jgi:hypothetical protein
MDPGKRSLYRNRCDFIDRTGPYETLLVPLLVRRKRLAISCISNIARCIVAICVHRTHSDKHNLCPASTTVLQTVLLQLSSLFACSAPKQAKLCTHSSHCRYMFLALRSTNSIPQFHYKPHRSLLN